MDEIDAYSRQGSIQNDNPWCCVVTEQSFALRDESDGRKLSNVTELIENLVHRSHVFQENFGKLQLG